MLEATISNNTNGLRQRRTTTTQSQEQLVTKDLQHDDKRKQEIPYSKSGKITTSTTTAATTNGGPSSSSSSLFMGISILVGMTMTFLNIHYLVHQYHSNDKFTLLDGGTSYTIPLPPLYSYSSIQRVVGLVDDSFPNTQQQTTSTKNKKESKDDSLTNQYCADTDYVDSSDYNPDQVQRFKSLQRQDYTTAGGVVSAKDSEECIPMHAWQLSYHPVCNVLHELHMSHSTLEYIDMGTATVVYEILGTNMVLKTPVFDEAMVDLNEASKEYPPTSYYTTKNHNGMPDQETQLQQEKDRLETEVPNYIPSDYEIRRIEAAVHERLSSSPYIAKMHAFCGMSFIAPMASEGTLYDLIASVRNGGDEPSPLDKLKISVQVAEGLAALHGIDCIDNRQPSFAHNDVDVNQHVYVDGIFQLNDFNFGYMLLQDAETHETCWGGSSMIPWKYRAPEDFTFGIYSGPYALEKADVFMMCNELYIVLTNLWLFEDMSREDAIDSILDGHRPPIPDAYWSVGSGTVQDRAHFAMVHAITEMCWYGDPDERATAREIADYLKDELYEILKLEEEEAEGDNAGEDDDEEAYNDKRMKEDGIVRVTIPPLLEDIIEDYNELM